MKSKRIRRAVRSVHPEREKGDAPARLGRISKIRLWFLPIMRRTKRRGKRVPEQSVEHRKRINRWTVRIGALAMASLAFAIWKGMPFQTERTTATPVAPAMRDDSEIRVKSRFKSLGEEESLKLVKGAMEIRDPKQVETYFRMGKSTPDEVIAFLENMPQSDGLITSYQWMGSMDANDLTMDGVVVAFDHSGAPRNRMAMLVPDEKEQWRVDFPAFSRQVEPGWDAILSGEAKQATVRVYVAEDNYFNGVFVEEGHWLCVSMGSPDTDEVLIGYFKSGSPQAAALRQISAVEVPASRTVLEIKRVEGGGSRQVEITRVVAEDWVVGDAPFDRKFE
ncbi:MAG: hypothetical protein V4640_08785 [Verrucomicrobiota bacterium]